MNYIYLADVAPNKKKYQIILTVYRDCDSGGAQLDDPGKIGIYKGFAAGGTLIDDFDAELTDKSNVAPVIPPCADLNNLPAACVQRGIYIFTVDLEISTNESYFVVYQRCCRTNQIKNIKSPMDFGATYMVEITPAAMAGNNSSPIFTNFPPGFICNNFFLEFDHSATDADGDSLVYEFCTPLHGGGRNGGGCDTPVPNPPCGPPFDTVVFINNYTSAKPMAGNPLIKIDPKTGLLSGTPTQNGQFVVGICVKEYRNGQLLSTALRDFQFNVVDCKSAVVADILEDEMLAPQTFLLKSCGQKNVTIVNQSPQSTALANQVWEFDLKNGNIFTSPSVNVIVPFPDYGEYFGRLYLNRNLQCSDTAYLVVRVFPPISANFGYDYDVCTDGYVYFSDSSVVEAPGGLVSRDWDFGLPGAVSISKNPDFKYTDFGQYVVQLNLKDVNGCESNATKEVDWTPHLIPKIPNPGQQLVCLPDSFSLQIFDPALEPDNHFSWDFGDGTPNFLGANPTHQFQKEGFYTFSVAIKNDYGCADTDTFSFINVRTRPSPDFIFTPKLVSNIENEVHFFNRSDSTGIYWLWNFGNIDGSHEQNPVFTFPDTGKYIVNLAVSNEYGCPDSLSKIVDVVPQVKLFIPNVFHPNSTDGLGNEKFGVLGILPGYSNFKMQVYGRWGELLFESKDPNEGWDGKKVGTNKLLSPGTYFYQISMNGPRGEPLKYEGSVSILN